MNERNRFFNDASGSIKKRVESSLKIKKLYWHDGMENIQCIEG